MKKISSAKKALFSKTVSEILGTFSPTAFFDKIFTKANFELLTKVVKFVIDVLTLLRLFPSMVKLIKAG